jgi:hypothetical protein
MSNGDTERFEWCPTSEELAAYKEREVEMAMGNMEGK